MTGTLLREMSSLYVLQVVIVEKYGQYFGTPVCLGKGLEYTVFGPRKWDYDKTRIFFDQEVFLCSRIAFLVISLSFPN